MQDRSLTVNNELNDQHSCLIIGCGTRHNHPTLHNKKEFYTIDRDQTRQPDLAGDIYDAAAQTYLSQNKFKLIVIESVPALVMTCPEKLRSLYAFLANCLDKDGTLVILSSGNLKDYSVLNTILFQKFESFELHYNNVAFTNSSDKEDIFPICTIIASHSTEPKLKIVDEYLLAAMEVKHYCRGLPTHVETIKRPKATMSASISQFGIHAPRNETETMLETTSAPLCKGSKLK